MLEGVEDKGQVAPQSVVRESRWWHSERLREVVEAATDWIAVFDSGGRVEYVNPALARSISGAGGGIGHSINEIAVFPRDLRQDGWRRVFSGETLECEWESQGGSSEPRWLSMRVTPLADAAGSASHAVAVIRDVTAEHRLAEQLRRQQELFAAMVEGAPDIIAVVDTAGVIRYVSPSVTRVSGWKPEEVIGTDMLAYAHPADAPLLGARLSAGLARGVGTKSPVRYRCRAKDGTWMVLESTASPLPGGAGYVIHTRDVTERVRMEDAARESEEKFRTVADTAPVAIFLYEGGRFTYVNSMAEIITGYAREELLAKDPWSLLHPDSVGPARERQVLRLAGQAPSTTRYELRIVRKDGTQRWVEYGGTVISLAGCRVVMGSVVDITERVLAEAALRESEERFRTVAEVTPAAIFVIEGDRIVYVNQAAEEITGYTAQEMMAMDPWTILHPDFRELSLERGRARKRGELVTSRYQLRIIRKDGAERWIEYSGRVTELQERQVVIGVALDITEAKVAEDALRDSEARFRALAEATPGATFIVRDLETIYVNDAAESLFGYPREELLKIPFLELVHPDFREQVRAYVLARQAGENPPARYEAKVLARGGTERWVDVSATIIDVGGAPAVLGLALDITARKQAEQALRDSEERLRAVVASAPIALWTVDASGVLTFSEVGGLEGKGYKRRVKVGDSVLTAYADNPEVVESHRRALAGQPSTHRFTFAGRTLESQLVPLKDANGAVTGVIGVALDITERLEDQRALRESEERYRVLYEENPSMYFTVDPAGVILSVNRYGAEELEYVPSELVGRPVTDVVQEADRRQFMGRLPVAEVHT